MIYSVILIDGDSGILLLEKQMRSGFDKKTNISPDVLAAFFRSINAMIDDIQVSMRKGRNVSNMTRTVLSEGSSIILYYHPQSRVLFCAITDPDDDNETITKILKKLGKRFWLKHRIDIEKFRRESIRDVFNAFSVEIDTFTLEGKAGEKFPRLLIAEMALDRVKTMGVISDLGYKIALKCDGKTSALKISRELDLNIEKIKRIMMKLEDLDIIQFP